MNSTDPKTSSAEIDRLFREVLVPLSETLKNEHQSFFETRTDPHCTSYYQQRSHRVVNQASFGPVGCEDVHSFTQALAALWTAQGYPELVPLAQAFGDLAESLRSVEDQTEEVSPYLYVMF